MRDKHFDELNDQLKKLITDVAGIKSAVGRLSPDGSDKSQPEQTENTSSGRLVSEINDLPNLASGTEEKCANSEGVEESSSTSTELEILRDRLIQVEEEQENSAVSFQELSAENQHLQERIEAERAEATELEKKVQEFQGRLEQAQEEINVSRDQNESFRAINISYEEEIKNLRATTDNFQATTEHLENDLTESRNQCAQIQALLDESLRENENSQANAKLNNRLTSIIWPTFLSSEEFTQWKQSLIEGLFAEPPSSGVMSTVTSLFSYNALCRMPEQESKRLIDVVYDLGLALYAWFDESGFDREVSFQNASLWADSINRENADNFTILIPEPDTPFDRKTMVSYDSDTTASPDVDAVRSWCIKDSEGRIQRQATVLLN